MRKIAKRYENPLDNLIIDFCQFVCPTFRKLGFTPNGVTTMSLLFGLFAIFCLYKGWVWWFAILYFISYVFDNLDGALARKYNMTSKFGDYYDHIKDIVVVIALIVVLILRNRCSKKVWIIAGIVVGIAFILMTAQLGCQEKIYKKTDDPTDESPSLSFTTAFCPFNPYEGCKYLRWFGCGTFVLILIGTIVYMEKTRICQI